MAPRSDSPRSRARSSRSRKSTTPAACWGTQDPAARRRRSEQAGRSVERGHQAHHAGQGRGGARRGGEPPHAGRRAGVAEISDSDDYARVDQRARDAGRRLHFPRLLHRSLSGRGAGQVRVQRPEGTQGRGAEGHSAGLFGRPHRFDSEDVHERSAGRCSIR